MIEAFFNFLGSFLELLFMPGCLLVIAIILFFYVGIPMISERRKEKKFRENGWDYAIPHNPDGSPKEKGQQFDELNEALIRNGKRMGYFDENLTYTDRHGNKVNPK